MKYRYTLTFEISSDTRLGWAEMEAISGVRDTLDLSKLDISSSSMKESFDAN